MSVRTGHAEGWFFQKPWPTGHALSGIVVVVVVLVVVVVGMVVAVPPVTVTTHPAAVAGIELELVSKRWAPVRPIDVVVENVPTTLNLMRVTLTTPVGPVRLLV